MKRLFLFAAILLISFQTYSQDSAKVLVLNQVLVTSVRADKNTPVTQKTIGDTSIQESYQGQEIPMILASTPSVYSCSDGGHAQGYTYFTLRGASQNRINMTLNGVPLNEPEDQGVYSSNFPSFINTVQSIQIQRGVGTSSNGSASFIGSINFQSKSGLKKGAEIQFGGGSYTTQRVNMSYSSGLLKNNLAFYANFGTITTQGFRNNSGSAGGSLFFSAGHYGSKSITKLIAFSGLSSNKMAWDGSTEAALAIDYKDNPRGDDNKDRFMQTHVQLHNIATLSEKERLTTTLYYNHLDGNYDVFNYRELQTIGYYAAEKQYSNWFGYISQYDYKSKDYNLSLGVSANTYTRNHSGREFFPADSLNYSNRGIKNELSGFAKLNFGSDEVREYLDVQARYVQFKYQGDVPMNMQSWLFINPKIGTKLIIDKNSDIYYSVGMSHREPTRSVMFGGGLYLTTLNNIKAEKVIDFELGTNIKKKSFSIQSNLFLMKFENEIIPAGPLGSNSLPIMINVDNSVRYGFEFDGEVYIKNFTYAANTTLSKSEFGQLNRQQLFSPTVMLNQSLTYKKNGVSLSVNNCYYSKSYIDIENKNTVDGFMLFGFNASYEIMDYTISLQGNNVTNQKYFCNGYAIGNTKYLFPNALANYYVTIRVKI